MKEFKAPTPYPTEGRKLFLGGSIEMGQAEDWQKKVVADLSYIDDLVILNPRRDDWDPTWTQTPVPGSKFYEQVAWELEAQEDADVICYYFAKDTLSPITLLELGVFGLRRDKKVVVYVDDDYLRRGNVIMTCDTYNIAWSGRYDDFIFDLEEAIING